MKIKIVADMALNERDTVKAVGDAIRKKDVLKLVEEAVPSGEHFQLKMETDDGTIEISKL